MRQVRAGRVMRCVVAVALCALVGFAVAGDGKVKLDVEFPKALFIGTPKTIKSPNLDLKYKPPMLMIPEGAQNVALDKEISGSDEVPIIGELSYLTDGDKEGSDGSYVELGPGKQHVQVDLEATHAIYAVSVWHYHSQARVYFDVVVQVSDDPDFLKATTIFNNDHDNSVGLGVGKEKEYIETNKGLQFDAKGAKGRYIRFYSNGSTSSEMNHYIEVEVYGKPAK